MWIVGETCAAGVSAWRRPRNALRTLEQERDADARQALSSERLRIARELHDVVAHAMSVIAVQSGMGAHVIDTQPDEAKKALAGDRDDEPVGARRAAPHARCAARGGGSRRSLAPRALAGDVEALIETVRAGRGAGRAPLDRFDAEVMPPDSVMLNRYRILQEALTNVLKHAGPASVIVTIVERAGETTIEVVDDGRGLRRRRSRPGTPGGHGLVGMRERAALFGGSIEAGARPAAATGCSPRWRGTTSPMPVPFRSQSESGDDLRRRRRRPGTRAWRVQRPAALGARHRRRR